MGLAAAAVVPFSPILANGWVWDDDTSLTKNPLVRGAGGLVRIWFSGQNHDYWPLTSSAFWIEWRLWGERAAGYHAVSLALWAGAVILLWRILARLELPGAWFGALLFAVHPVNVESVAWITQQKNLLALFGALAAFRFFLDSKGLGSRAWWASWAAFVLAMLSKGSVATLPLIMLGSRIGAPPPAVPSLRRTLRELAPFFAVAVVLTAVNAWLQHRGELEPIRSASPVVRLMGAGAVIWFYLGKALWPAGLVFVYPSWQISAGDWLWWLPAFCAAAVSAALAIGPWRGLRNVWFYYLICLLPVLGLVDVYYLKYSLVADHYQQPALIGITAGVAALIVARLPKPSWVPSALLFAAAVMLGALSWRLCGDYRGAETLFRATVARNPAAWMAWNNLGNLQGDRGQTAAAIASFQAALRARPDFAEAENNLGFELAAQGDKPAAAVHFTRALALRPAYPEAENNLALALHDGGQSAGALIHARRAVDLRPDYAEGRNTVGLLLAEAGDLPGASAQFRLAIAAQPNFAGAHLSLGTALASQNDLAGAAAEHRRAAALDPGSVEAHADLGIDLARLGQMAEAAKEFQAALRLRPGDPQLRRYLEQTR